MLMRKFKNSRKPSEEFKDLLVRLETIRAHGDLLVLYGQSTGSNWLGISIATTLIFPNESIEIPQEYSSCMLSSKQQTTLLNTIITLGFERVLFSGFAEYGYAWVQQLKEHAQIEVIYHGTFAELHNPNNQCRFEEITSLAQKGDIQRVGFIHKTMANTIQKLLGFECYTLDIPKPNLKPLASKIKLDTNFVHVGVFGGDTFNKNLHNQVAHALLNDRVIVHVADNDAFKYLGQHERIIGHGKNLPREAFLQILGSMDLNLYCSFSESWGLVVAESEAMGVPCLGPIDYDYLSAIGNIASRRKTTS